MVKFTAYFLLLISFTNCVSVNESKTVKTAEVKSLKENDWQLKWADEFNENGLPNANNWNYIRGGDGFGNHELQFYTVSDSSTAYVKNGNLTITANKKTIEKNKYSSARLTTAGKHSFKYGRYECRAKLPKGLGTWPAFWMLGDNISTAGWPLCGEIDIMEHVGYQPDSIVATIHSKAYNHTIGTQRGKIIFVADPYDTFHIYSVEWSAQEIIFFMDGVEYNRITNEHKTEKEWPFDQPFYILLNLAIGGDWGGKFGVEDRLFPAKYVIDYVRVYQKNLSK